MAITDERFITGEQVAVTNGTRKVTFDTPSDFADWALSLTNAELAGWQWVAS